MLQLDLANVFIMLRTQIKRQLVVISVDSTEDRDWSEQTQTFYYSKFELFDHNEHISRFHQYTLFVDRIFRDLGEQWNQQASVLYSPYLNSKDVFIILLSMWLHHHPVVNNVQLSQQTLKTSPTFSQNYLQDFNMRISQQLAIKKCENFKINKTTGKAVCMGFFMTANEIWEEMFQKKEQGEKKGFSIFSGVSKKIQQSFQPLMVVTEKITNLFGKKKVKKFQQIQLDMPQEDKKKITVQCYKEFKKTVEIEQELIKKMNDFSLVDDEDQKDSEKKKKITKHEFREDQSPVAKSSLGNIYQCVTKYLGNQPWQVANNFVTNILDIDQINNEGGARVKILKPAQDFYQKLIIFWITLKNKNNRQISFEEFKENVKCSFGTAWKQKLIIPLKYFYEMLSKNWEQIMSHTGDLKIHDKLLMDTLIKKLRQTMKIDWQQKIKIQKKKKSVKRKESI